MRRRLIVSILLAVMASGCIRTQSDVVVVTATFVGNTQQNQPQLPQDVAVPSAAFTPQQGPYTNPTPDATRQASTPAPQGQQYVVQPGDTLFSIAEANGISLQSLISANSGINPDILNVGQIIQLPGAPSQMTSDFKVMPDSRVVFGPGASNFDVAAFIAQQPGFIRSASDIVNGALLSGADVVKRVAWEYSVDPRILLALIELKSGWLTNASPSDDQRQFPMGINEAGFDRTGLYKQLAWACDRLNTGYYGWKNRGLTTLEFGDGTRLLYANGLNAGTVALQYLLSLNNTVQSWQPQVEQGGFYQTYAAYFGNPFLGAVDPVVPPDVQQPALVFPFPAGQMWYFTGGPHGGYGDGSAWAAVDFAPPDDLETVSSACYVSQFYATAVASGVIARTAEGQVILDLDGDGDESTGWTISYLHMASESRVEAGTRVNVGDNIGHPSCEGGVSNGTHMHIARRFNGEWIPVYCDACAVDQPRPPWLMSGWTLVGLPGQVYQGYMVKDNEQRVADQGRANPDNQVTW